GRDTQKGSFLGPQFSPNQVASFLRESKIPQQRFARDDEFFAQVTQLRSEGKIIGWFGGRMEFGPRALGARSIIGDARNPQMQSTMNVKIKCRESFRPCAPCVLRERVSDYFEMRSDQESPSMLMVAPVLEKHRVKLSE